MDLILGMDKQMELALHGIAINDYTLEQVESAA